MPSAAKQLMQAKINKAVVKSSYEILAVEADKNISEDFIGQNILIILKTLYRFINKPDLLIFCT